MFDLKTLKLLSLLFRKFNKKRPKYEDVKDYIFDIGLADALSKKDTSKNVYELVHNLTSTFYFNWLPTGDFKSIKNPIIIPYNVFHNLSNEQLALMTYLDDFNPENYNDFGGGMIDSYSQDNIYYVMSQNPNRIKNILSRLNYNPCTDWEVVKDYVNSELSESGDDFAESGDDFAKEYASLDADTMSDEELLSKQPEFENALINLENEIQFQQDRIDKREQIMTTLEQRIEVAEREFDDKLVATLDDKIIDLDNEITAISDIIFTKEDEMSDILDEARNKVEQTLYQQYKGMIRQDPINFLVNFKKEYKTVESFIQAFLSDRKCSEAISDFFIHENDPTEIIEFLNTKNLRLKNNIITKITYNEVVYFILY